MPKRLGTETSRAEIARCRNVWARNILMPKRLVADTSRGQNVLVLSCYLTLLITVIRKEHVGGAKQDVKLCNTVLAFTHSQNQSI